MKTITLILLRLGYFLNLNWKFPEVTRKLPHFRKFPEVKRDISRKVGNFQKSNGIFPGQLEISRGQTGYFQDSWKFPEVSQDISRRVGYFQRSTRIFPGRLEISRGQSGYFQESRKFPEISQDISRGVGYFQRWTRIFPGELEISKRLKKTHLINLHHCSQNQASLLLLGMLR